MEKGEIVLYQPDRLEQRMSKTEEKIDFQIINRTARSADYKIVYV